MIAVKFPSLHKALLKNVKDLPENDPRRGVIVLEGKAIVFTSKFCLVCDLYDYFTIEAGVEDELEIESLNRILYFMDQKVFTVDYWKELTIGSDVSIKEDNLHIKNPKYSKTLYYKDLHIDITEPLEKLLKSRGQGMNHIPAIALPYSALNSIYTVYPSEFKTDNMILEFSAQDKFVKFTFRDRKHFFGFINPHYDAVQEGFRFDAFENFVNDFEQILMDLQDEKISKLPPPPGTKFEEE